MTKNCAYRIIDADGYVRLYRPEHPKAGSNGYVMEHVLVAEKAIGKYLPDGAVVHHINELRGDNRNENLLVCDRAYHATLHARMRARQATGNPNWLRCSLCKTHDAPENLSVMKPRKPGHIPPAYHKECARVRTVERRRKIKAETYLLNGQTKL